MVAALSTPFAIVPAQSHNDPAVTSVDSDAGFASGVPLQPSRRVAIVVPAGSVDDSELAMLVAHLSSSSRVSQHQRNVFRLKGATKAAIHAHTPRTIESCWDLRGRRRPQSQGQTRKGPEEIDGCSASLTADRVINANNTHCRLHSTAGKAKTSAQQKAAVHMSPGEMEDWWSLSPEDLAIVQADPNAASEIMAKLGVAGAPAHGGDVAVDSWATEITTKWRAVISQQKAAAGAASFGGTPLQSPRGKPPPGGLGSDAPLASTVTAGRILWSKLKVVALAHLAAQAKQKAKQALEIADAVAQEERVAMQQNGDFIFRSSNSVKPATDLPEDMVKRVRAATTGYCTRESHTSSPTPTPGRTPRRRSSRGASTSHGDRHKTKQRYPTPWYVPSDMWGSHIESKLKVKVLAKTGETDPDFLKATGLESLEWAQGAEQQAAQMYKKYIRQSGVRVPHYLRSVKTPEINEDMLLSSRVNWGSRPISRSNTAKPNAPSLFANPRDRLQGVYAVQDGNQDHMAVVAAAMQQGKVGKSESRQASTRATIRGILSGIK